MVRDLPPLLVLLGAAWVARRAGLPGGPVLLGAGLCLALSTVRSLLARAAARDGYSGEEPRQRFARRALLGTEWLAAAVFGAEALVPLVGPRVPVVLAVGGALLLLLAALLTALARRTPPPVGEERHWLWGAIYLNPRDRTLLVPGRIGAGLTVNLGRPLGWLLLLAPLAAAALGGWWLAGRM